MLIVQTPFITCEVDHQVPLCFGGTNELDNLAALCEECHREKSYHEDLSHCEDRNPLVSRLNRETYQMFHLSPKPPQMVGNMHPHREGKAFFI